MARHKRIRRKNLLCSRILLKVPRRLHAQDLRNVLVGLSRFEQFSEDGLAIFVIDADVQLN